MTTARDLLTQATLTGKFRLQHILHFMDWSAGIGQRMPKKYQQMFSLTEGKSQTKLLKVSVQVLKLSLNF